MKPLSSHVADLEPLLEDTNLAYYWVGFMLADAGFESSRPRFQIVVSESRSAHLQQLKNFLNYEGEAHDKRLAIRDALVIPKLKKKFGITSNKTYEPADLKWIRDTDLFTSLAIGFIDGDGMIAKQTGREDTRITIKVHQAWIENLQLISDRLGQWSETEPPNAYENPEGYAVLNLANSVLQQKLKKHTETHSLPVINEKWKNIDLDYESRRVTARKRRQQYRKLVRKGYSKKRIAEELGVVGSAINRMIEDHDLAEPKVKNMSVSQKKAEEILNDRENGDTQKKIADRYDVSIPTVRRITNNHEKYVPYYEPSFGMVDS
jgi:transposase